jgi:hypothetical protein
MGDEVSKAKEGLIIISIVSQKKNGVDIITDIYPVSGL